ncbi:twinfilin TWF1 KNAG_0B01220 [Huiozyma naganishii CBS 8797]|uniref:ADF-H domain-containing protein n=1 Tax=Huiozyma naganishii (strain ATCC MYA-139 / BCRC 22969 / CBS 8797 / KCTC 17520 / NBRC 10181 / NCYC 3082 / Yp74L-3) TaxID=1071383 RepID=J7S386_HUIN7|nr:hypothetical protein KNAG_0B01220 [Kazachstania naganishii CBS 8797]CCK68569.1 hypothetical protein KNAG_0B01220 [Kazachstania naganishii CBS 8797]
MSNQSGIFADQSLLDVFVSSPAPDTGSQFRIITAKIPAEANKVELAKEYDTIDQLKADLDDAQPLYIFVKDYQQDPDCFHFVSYVPDNSPVRSKMLYASTKNTILRQVGSHKIGKQALLTEAGELSEFINIAGQTPQPTDSILTESEKIEKEINDQQRRMRTVAPNLRGHELVSQNNATPGQLSFNVTIEEPSLSTVLAQNNVISFRIENEEVKIVDRSRISSPEQLSLITEHPSYTVFQNGQLNYFIYTCPSGSKVKERMIYASNRRGFIQHLENEENLQFAKVIEIGEPEELEISLISKSTPEEIETEESTEQQNDTRRFNKPKGPGGRRRRA